MKINATTLRKNNITKALSKEYMLVTLTDESKVSAEKVKRQALNVCFVIDNSGSMDDRIETPEWKAYNAKVTERNRLIQEFYREHRNYNNPMPPIFPQPEPYFLGGNMINCFPQPVKYPELPQELREFIPIPEVITKMTQAKKAMHEAVSSLVDGDIVSIVSFSNTAKVILEPTVIGKDSAPMLNAAINNIRSGGGTNLYDGWYLGATKVSQNYSKEKVNRVEILTDGEITVGINNVEDITKKVSVVFEAGVTTTTFGFGDKFNEVLLEGMAVSGNGNFYYINQESDLSAIFMEEFDDIKNTGAQGIELSFDVAKGVKVKNITSSVLREKSPGVFVLPNIRMNASRSVLFELELEQAKSDKKTKEDKTFEALVVNVKYINKDGKAEFEKEALKLTYVSEATYNKTEEVDEIKIQKALIEVAENQRKAMEDMQKGNIEGAKLAMANSLSITRSIGANDARMQVMGSTLATSLSAIDDVNNREAVKKDMFYSSYKGLRGE